MAVHKPEQPQRLELVARLNSSLGESVGHVQDGDAIRKPLMCHRTVDLADADFKRTLSSSFDQEAQFQDIRRCSWSSYGDKGHPQSMKQHPKEPVLDVCGPAYVCSTQKPYKIMTSGLVLNKDIDINMVSRWIPGSELTYFVSRKNLPEHTELFEKIKTGMHDATDRWRRTGVNITFKEIQVRKDATILVTHDPKLDSNIYADAFFPGDKRRVIRIGSLVLKDIHINFIYNVLCHELGHVLGLRHERHGEAAQEDANICYFPKKELNLASIMNAAKASDISTLNITPQDEVEIRSFYNLTAKDQPDCGFRIKDYPPEPAPLSAQEKCTSRPLPSSAQEDQLPEPSPSSAQESQLPESILKILSKAENSKAVTPARQQRISRAARAATAKEDKRQLRHIARRWSEWCSDGAGTMRELGVSYHQVSRGMPNLLVKQSNTQLSIYTWPGSMPHPRSKKARNVLSESNVNVHRWINHREAKLAVHPAPSAPPPSRLQATDEGGTRRDEIK